MSRAMRDHFRRRGRRDLAARSTRRPRQFSKTQREEEIMFQDPLHGIQCRGFELYAGGTRGMRAALLFEAQRTEAGEWQFGPREYLHDYYSPRSWEWEQLIRERECAPFDL